jgi:carbonic anhydrase
VIDQVTGITAYLQEIGSITKRCAKVLSKFSVISLMSIKTITGSSTVRLKFFIAICAVSLPFTATAAWQTISAEQGKRVEIDRASIKKDEGGRSTALGRIILDKAINDPKTASSYRIIEALNRFDCAARTVSTVKRSYFKEEGDLLREEEVKTQLEMPVRSGTLDDKLLREVCRPKAGAESTVAASKMAEKVNEAAGELRKANATLMEKETKHAAAPAQAPAPVAVKPEPEAKAMSKPEPKAEAEPKIEAKPMPAPVAQAAVAPKPRRSKPAPVTEHAAQNHAHAHIHWSYEGVGGPENWGKLNADYVTCSNGKRQSPIDIRDGIRVDLEPIQFAYRPSNFRVVDNGHTVQVSLAGGSISLLGKSYQLIQFHFHRPSEERVNGKAFDMVAHLVHKSEDGKLAVVAVLLEKGRDNPLIQTVWNNLPLEKNETVAPPELTLDLAQLLPENRNYYTYMGSLTTPPCSEGVLWLVLKQPQQMSVDQLAIFSQLYRNNARPVQSGFTRMIKESR